MGAVGGPFDRARDISPGDDAESRTEKGAFMNSRVPRIIAFLILASITIGVRTAAAETRALLLNSYHKGYYWTDQQSDSIESVLRADDPDLNIDIEYLDWKRHPDPSQLLIMKALLSKKFEGMPPKIIITTDDAALIFCLNYKAEIFGDAPVVYTGVFQATATELTRGRTDTTGVYEFLDPGGSIELAKRINPGLREVHIVHDSSESSLSFEKEVMDVLSARYPSMTARTLRDMSFSELKRRLSALPANSAVLLTSYARDSEGLIKSPETFAEEISDASPAPVYTYYTHLIDSGVVGGGVLDGRIEGTATGRLALEVLRGVSPARLPPVDHGALRVVVNHKAATRLGLPIDDLPADVEIVGKPFSFLDTYRDLVLGVAFVFLVMASLLIALIVNIVQRRHAKVELLANLASLERSRRDLQLSEERYRLVARMSRDILWDWDIDNDIRTHSGRVAEVLGFSADEFGDGRKGGSARWLSLIHPDDAEMVKDAIARHLEGGSDEYRAEYRVRTARGDWIWLAANGCAIFDAARRPHRMVGSLTDITEVKEHQRRVHHLAYHDALTDLGNRLKLGETVRAAIAERAASRGSLALAFIDMDNFKFINDSHGHKVGDLILVAVADRLRDLVSDERNVARLGGDEFVVLLRDADEGGLIEFQARLTETMRVPFLVSGNRFYLGCSVGVAVHPDDGATFEDLLQSADTAMYDAKIAGRGSVAMYSPEMRTRAVERSHIHNRLRDAEERREFSLCFQPQVDTRDGRIRGAEALLRWRDGEMGMVPPDKFIPACEETGLIIPVGRWVLARACEQLRRMNASARSEFVMSVNVSVVQLMSGRFVEEVVETLEEEGVPPSLIELEITESQLMGVFEEGAARLRKLMDAGVKIALDDFGTGYSSLNYLRRLPLDTLKLDKEFVRWLPGEPLDRQLARSIIRIAHEIGLSVVAEGVERPDQRDQLADAGCDWLQGYLIGRPMNGDAFEDFTRNWRGFDQPPAGP